jgi:heme-degrading monooxygenase HmoA
MIARIWHGYTTKGNAGSYEKLLKEEVFVGIAHKNIKGYKGIRLLRRELEDETEFTTIMQFESIEDVKMFAGEDYETAYVPAKARLILKRFDPKSVHCQILYEINY